VVRRAEVASPAARPFGLFQPPGAPVRRAARPLARRFSRIRAVLPANRFADGFMIHLLPAQPLE
jgi:hypothetical protein